MRALRALALAVTLAAICVLPALAGPEGDPDPCDPAASNCLLTPPQSVQVNPHPLRADGTPIDVPASGGLAPVEVTIPMPAPGFVDPMPLGSEGTGSSAGGASGSGSGTSAEIAGGDGYLLVGADAAVSSGAGVATAGSVGAAQALALAGFGTMGVVATASQALKGRLYGRYPSAGSTGRGTQLGGYRPSGRVAGNGAPKDREERLLPRASWLPGPTSATTEATSSSAGYFPPVTGAPRGEIPAWLRSIPGNVGSALRGFDRSDGNWGALGRSVQRLTHAQVPSLEGMINRGVQGLGGWVDRRVEGLNRLVMRAGEGWDSATGPLTDRINRWAAGEPSAGSGPRGTVGGFLRAAWEGARDRLDEQLAALRQPNSPEFTGRLNTVGGLAAGLSLAGNIGFGITGRPGWRDAAGVGTVLSGGVDLVGLRSSVVTAVNFVRGSQVTAAVSTVGKVSGVLSAVTGVLTMATEVPRVVNDLRANGGRLSEQGGIAAVKAVTGLASTVGGLLLLTPAAPIGGAILAVSGIASAVTWGYENRERLANGLRAYQGVARNAATIANVVSQRVLTAVQQSPVGRAVQTAAITVSQAASSVRGFLGRVFSGGSQASSPSPSPAPRPSPMATPHPATSTPARLTPQATHSTPSPSQSRTPSPVRSTPAPSHSSAPRSSPARPATPSRSPSSRFGR